MFMRACTQPFKKGMIISWSGSVATIPGGWALCNGDNGTPDLRDRFVVGVGTTYNPDDSGGAATHTHTFTGDGHYHSLPEGQFVNAIGGTSSITTTDAASGTTDADSNLPPYYGLAYIMKL